MTMWYYRRLPGGLVVMHTRIEHASQLEDLQRVCFPTLAAASRSAGLQACRTAIGGARSAGLQTWRTAIGGLS
jgi:hypothetical protein